MSIKSYIKWNMGFLILSYLWVVAYTFKLHKVANLLLVVKALVTWFILNCLLEFVKTVMEYIPACSDRHLDIICGSPS